MCVDTESEIWSAIPILAVVSRLPSGPREVGDFVLAQAAAFEKLARPHVKRRNHVVRRNVAGGIARSAREKLRTEAAVFVGLKNVDGNMLGRETRGGFKRLFPTLGRLVRQSRYQVNADIRDSRTAKHRKIALDCCKRVHASGGAQFALHQRLHAQADAIYSQVFPRPDEGRIECPRRGLNGTFRVTGDFETLMQRVKESRDLLGRKQARRSATEINGIRRHWLRRPNLGLDRGQVTFQLRARKHSRRKVAVSAFELTKRDGDIDSVHASISSQCGNSRAGGNV